MKIEWTDKKKNEVCEAIELWLLEHHAYSGEMMAQDDDCNIFACELLQNLVDDIIKPTIIDEED